MDTNFLKGHFLNYFFRLNSWKQNWLSNKLHQGICCFEVGLKGTFRLRSNSTPSMTSYMIFFSWLFIFLKETTCHKGKARTLKSDLGLSPPWTSNLVLWASVSTPLKWEVIIFASKKKILCKLSIQKAYSTIPNLEYFLLLSKYLSICFIMGYTAQIGYVIWHLFMHLSCCYQLLYCSLLCVIVIPPLQTTL